MAALFPTACKTCRRRGRKCDRTLPACISCQKKSIKCEGYVTRWVGVAARGPQAGKMCPIALDSQRHTSSSGSTGGSGWRTDVTSNSGGRGGPRVAKISNKGNTAATSQNHITATSLVPTKPTRNISVYESRGMNKYPSDSHRNPNPEDTKAIGSNLNEQLSTKQWFPGDIRMEALIEYYAREITGIFYLGDGPIDSPYIDYILPMVDHIPSVRYAVAATASCHLSHKLADDELGRQSLKLLLQATRLLREGLLNPEPKEDLASLATILLLAQIDICSGGCEEFETHLKGAISLVRLRGSDGTDRCFFEQRLVWMDIMGSTMTPRMPLLSSVDVKNALNKFQTPSGRDWGYDVFYCPIDLFEYVADITMLYKLQYSDAELRHSTLDKATRLGNAVQAWHSPIYKSGPRFHVVQAWRAGILIYLSSLFELTPDIFDVPGLVKSTFYHIKAIPPDTSWRMSTMWPLFQAGLRLPPHDSNHDAGQSEDKMWVNSELRSTFQRNGCGHRMRAMEVLQKVWCRSDVDRQYNSIMIGIFANRLMVG